MPVHSNSNYTSTTQYCFHLIERCWHFHEYTLSSAHTVLPDSIIPGTSIVVHIAIDVAMIVDWHKLTQLYQIVSYQEPVLLLILQFAVFLYCKLSIRYSSFVFLSHYLFIYCSYTPDNYKGTMLLRKNVFKFEFIGFFSITFYTFSLAINEQLFLLSKNQGVSNLPDLQQVYARSEIECAAQCHQNDNCFFAAFERSTTLCYIGYTGCAMTSTGTTVGWDIVHKTGQSDIY